MKSLYLLKFQKGFTLIELLLVMAMIGAVAGLGITSFIGYTRSNALSQATSDFVNALNTAKSKAYSQVIPSGCVGSLSGYSVQILSSTTYKVSAVCSGGSVDVAKLVNFGTSSISIVTAPSPPPSNVFFEVLTGLVSGGASSGITISGFGNSKIINISRIGVISVE